MTIERDQSLVDSFVNSMIEDIRFFSNGMIPNNEIPLIAKRIVSRLDFNDEWQMHKGIGYYARAAVETYLCDTGKA